MSSPLYLLDTNMVSYSVKCTYPAVRAKLLQVPVDQVAISAITETELRFWVTNRPNETRVKTLVDSFLGRIASMPWDSGVTESYAQLKAACKHAGKALAELDMLIAAHALHLEAVLVTHDQAFNHIAGLRIEDWV